MWRLKARSAQIFCSISIIWDLLYVLAEIKQKSVASGGDISCILHAIIIQPLKKWINWQEQILDADKRIVCMNETLVNEALQLTIQVAAVSFGLPPVFFHQTNLRHCSSLNYNQRRNSWNLSTPTQHSWQSRNTLNTDPQVPQQYEAQLVQFWIPPRPQWANQWQLKCTTVFYF